MPKTTLFRVSYYILVGDSRYYWTGNKWETAKYEAKHYQTWKAAKAAQRQLRFNSIFKERKSQIQAFKKP